MFDLSGRTALVTGAGRGIGSGIAMTLARQGARVVVNDIDAERATAMSKQLKDLGHDSAASAFDVTDTDATKAAFQRLSAEVGTVDILVCNAGIPPVGLDQTAFVDSDPASWAAPIDVNLAGFMNCMHAALPAMRNQKWGRVILISSEAGRVGMGIQVGLYGAGKAGALGLARHVAVEVAPFGVTVNALSLGLINNVQSDWADRIARTIPCGRLGSPDDVAAGVVFFASEEAGWITGQLLPVNGGSTIIH